MVIDELGRFTVSYPEYIEFKFSIIHPEGANWTATLSNGHDFEFDLSDNAVSSGIVKAGQINTIRIKPKNQVYVSGIKTELYIVVNNSMLEHVEIDLNGNSSTGEGNRFIITQIPY